MFKNKILLAGFFFLLKFCYLTAQTDTIGLNGTIKVSKIKNEIIYIRAFAQYPKRSDYFQPFPVVEGYAFPFNYTRYFNEKFKNEIPDLKGRLNDTIRIEINITEKGKVFLKSETADSDNILNMQCLDFLKQIKKWHPGYIIIPEKGTFKKQTVIKPRKTNVSSIGIITILFSLQPFEN